MRRVHRSAPVDMDLQDAGGPLVIAGRLTAAGMRLPMWERAPALRSFWRRVSHDRATAAGAASVPSKTQDMSAELLQCVAIATPAELLQGDTAEARAELLQSEALES
ncbi:unnamed protein product [Prorocentrum cordatum]|uniref:Uncharacterized protein n=1 Tax=Prorocentrum cordatum TaxID=2364126 RepID=A0ABN9SZU0_9DINO|nr:unnamed protein product [Polarella glacialis]